MTDQIRAPWTPEQVAALNRFQAEGGMHPFTCGNDHATGALHLVAHEDGWHCWLPDCDYRQDWAHAFMTDPNAWPKSSLAVEPEPSDPAQCSGEEGFCPEHGFHRHSLKQPDEVQDGPHAPQDGPERPDAGAETPDGGNGAQAATEPLARLRDQLAAEHAKAQRSDKSPRPDLDHLRVTPHNGIAAGLEVAISVVDHHLREAGEEARTTADNGATSSNASDNSLREQYAAALTAELTRYARSDIDPGTGSDVGDQVATVLAVRDRELERLRTDLADEQAAYRSRTDQWKRVLRSRDRTEDLCRQLAAALTEVLAEPRIPDSGGETAVHIGPVKCTQVERWRKVLAAARQADDGPSVQEAAADDARWWNGEKEGA